MIFFFAFDIGLVAFFIFIIIAGIILAFRDISANTVGFMLEHLTTVSLSYLGFVILASIGLYFSIYGTKNFKKHLMNFISWIIVNVLISLPLISIIYFSVIPQIFTDLLNMIVSIFFFSLLIMFYLSAYFALMDALHDSEVKPTENRNRKLVFLFLFAIAGLVFGYFINHIAIVHTSSSIYISLYGDKLGGFLVSWVENTINYFNSR